MHIAQLFFLTGSVLLHSCDAGPAPSNDKKPQENSSNNQPYNTTVGTTVGQTTNGYPNNIMQGYAGQPGQTADVTFEVNGSAQPVLIAAPNAPVTWTFMARSVNMPGRPITITRVTPQPMPPGMTISPPGQPTITVTWPSANQAVTIQVAAQDSSLCQGGAACPEQTGSFSYNPTGAAGMMPGIQGNNAVDPMLLGAGIGALGGMFTGDAVGGAFGGAMAGLIASSGFSNNPMGGGYAYMLGSSVNPFANPMLMAQGMGQYPGYGYPGLGGSNLYGGYYNNTGYGYGNQMYLNNYNPNGWGSQGFYSPYQYSGYNYNNYGANYNNTYGNRYSNRLGSDYDGLDDYGNNYSGDYSNSMYHDPYSSTYGYGSSGYYNGYGNRQTYGSRYFYGNNRDSNRYYFGLADSSAGDASLEGLAH